MTDIGFHKVGEFTLPNEDLDIKIDKEIDSPNVLYAFVSEDEPLYIGKTTKGLERRMNSYIKPGSTQTTNIKNNKKIKEVLKNKKTVELYALPDLNALGFGIFHLNLVAGLEDDIIRKIAPEWNQVGI